MSESSPALQVGVQPFALCRTFTLQKCTRLAASLVTRWAWRWGAAQSGEGAKLPPDGRMDTSGRAESLSSIGSCSVMCSCFLNKRVI